MPPSVCLYVVGAPPPPIERRLGTFTDWFQGLLGRHPIEVEAVDGTAGQPPARRFDAYVVTGTPASLTAPEMWMEAAVELVRRCYEERTPLFGVCFGHQLIGAAFGGSVVENPRGWEMSTHPVTLTDEGRRDPLFAGMPAEIEVNLSHRDVIDERTLPPLGGVQVLAGNERSPVQALAAGPVIRGVQWHPEFSGAIVRAYVETRAGALAADAAARGAAADHPARLLERARDTPWGARVLDNFVEHFVLDMR